MMTSDEFKSAWEDQDDVLVRFSPDALFGRGLSPAAVTFLQDVGLPQEAAPFLAFGGACRPVEPPGGREGYFVIGSDGSGSPIVIAAGGQVEVLDHDRDFAATYLGKDVEALAKALLRFRDLVETTQEIAGEDGYLDGAVPQHIREEFVEFLDREDPRALEPSAFWAREIGAWV